MKKILLSIILLCLVASVGFSGGEPTINPPLPSFITGAVYTFQGTLQNPFDSTAKVTINGVEHDAVINPPMWSYPWNVDQNTEATYTLSVVGYKQNPPGDASPPFQTTFKVDTKNPVISITSPTEGSIAYYPSNPPNNPWGILITGDVTDANKANAISGPNPPGTLTISTVGGVGNFECKYYTNAIDGPVGTFKCYNTTVVNGLVSATLSFTDDANNVGTLTRNFEAYSTPLEPDSMTVTTTAPVVVGSTLTVTANVKYKTAAVTSAALNASGPCTIAAAGFTHLGNGVYRGTCTPAGVGTFTLGVTATVGAKSVYNISSVVVNQIQITNTSLSITAPATGNYAAGSNVTVRAQVLYGGNAVASGVTFAVSGTAGCSNTVLNYTSNGVYQGTCILTSSIGDNKTIIIGATYNSSTDTKTAYINIISTSTAGLTATITSPTKTSFNRKEEATIILDVKYNGVGVSGATVNAKTPIGLVVPMLDMNDGKYQLIYSFGDTDPTPAVFNFNITSNISGTSQTITKELSITLSVGTLNVSASFDKHRYSLGETATITAIVVYPSGIKVSSATVKATIGITSITMSKSGEGTYTATYTVASEEEKISKVDVTVNAVDQYGNKGSGTATSELETVTLSLALSEVEGQKHLLLPGHTKTFLLFLQDKDNATVSNATLVMSCKDGQVKANYNSATQQYSVEYTASSSFSGSLAFSFIALKDNKKSNVVDIELTASTEFDLEAESKSFKSNGVIADSNPVMTFKITYVDGTVVEGGNFSVKLLNQTEVPLTYNSSTMLFSARLDLSGLAYGDYSLLLSGTSTNGNQLDATIPFKYQKKGIDLLIIILGVIGIIAVIVFAIICIKLPNFQKKNSI